MFFDTYKQLNNIINSNDKKDVQVKKIKGLIINLYDIYKEINKIILFPPNIASIEYSYNKLFHGFIVLFI